MGSSDITVLLVEDDEDMSITLKEFISKMGVNVCTANSAAAARRLIQDQPHPFDLVLSDLKLPDGNGMDILGAAHARSPETLVTIVTGYGSMQTALEAIRQGAYDFLTKPFTLEEIGVQVRNMVERASLSRENARLSIRMQELYEKVHRLQNERSEILRFQDDIREEMVENSRKLDLLLASRPQLREHRTPSDVHPDRTLVTTLFRDLEKLDRLRACNGLTQLEVEEKKRDLIQHFVESL